MPAQKRTTPYIPINCDFYDYLEIYAMRKQLVTIKLENANGEAEELRSQIYNLYTQDKIEYMQLDEGRIIRLDQLREVEGKVVPLAC